MDTTESKVNGLYRGYREELNTFTMTLTAQLFGLMVVSYAPQMKVTSVNVKQHLFEISSHADFVKDKKT